MNPFAPLKGLLMSWRSIRRFLVGMAVLSLSAALIFFDRPAQANNAQILANMNVFCGAVNASTRIAHCFVSVPGSVIGTELKLELAKGDLVKVKNVERAGTLPSSALFMRLEEQDQLQHIDLHIDYAELSTQASADPTYAVAEFDLELGTNVDLGQPTIISATIVRGSALHTISAGQIGTASYLQDVPFSIRLSAALPTTATPPPPPVSVPGGFHYAADTGQTCFDDPSFAMTAAEWDIICDAKRRGIISGNPRDNGVFFFPNQQVIRAEAVKILTKGILQQLGYLDQNDFDEEEAKLERAYRNTRTRILYPDVGYESPRKPFWYAVFVSIANREHIAEGYPDGTFQPEQPIRFAEGYRTIVETAARASVDVASVLEDTTRATRRDEWFMKYVGVLLYYDIPFSEEYGEFMTRKEFLILVMEQLGAVGL